jgi:hypothetical protein
MRILLKATLMIKLSEIIGIPLGRMVYIVDNQTDYLASQQIGIPFIEARQAARLMGEKTSVHPEPGRMPFGFFETNESEKLADLLRELSRQVAARKYQMPGR